MRVSLARESAHLTLLGLIAGTGVYRGLGKSTQPPAPLLGIMAGEGLLSECLPGLAPGSPLMSAKRTLVNPKNPNLCNKMRKWLKKVRSANPNNHFSCFWGKEALSKA